MTAQIGVADFCRYALDTEQGQFAHDPCAWERFSENTPVFSAPQALRRPLIWCGPLALIFKTSLTWRPAVLI